jgi:DNA-directed RNA polymerase specialized sigma24 family protein
MDMSRPDVRAHFDRLVRNIQAGDDSSSEELSRLLRPGVRFFIARSLDAVQVDDIAGDVLARVIKAIRERELHDPDHLLGYVRGVVQLRICSAGIDHRKPPRRNPEDGRLAGALSHLTGREREILTRFYMEGQAEDRILAEMRLSSSQFRELKSAVRAEIERIKDTCSRG